MQSHTDKIIDLVNAISMSSLSSDHHIVNISATTNPQVPSRKFRDINIACFIDDLRNSELITKPPDDLRELCELYDSTMADIVDKNSPVITKTMFDTRNVPWYTKDIQAAKRHRRYCERLWRRTRLTVHHDMFLQARLNVRDLLVSCKAAYYSNKINKCNGSQKAIFNVVSNVLHRKQDILPDSFDSQQEMADGFSKFFQQKIQTIRDQFDTPEVEQNESIPYCQYRMSRFKRLSETDVMKLIRKSSSAFCDLDPAPTWLIIDCADRLI